MVLTVVPAMMPRYEDPPWRLYRGAAARTAERRVYGMSWIDLESPIIRTQEAVTSWRRRRARNGGALDAIVCRVPDEEFHDEAEYIADGSALDAVEIVRRYPIS